jgi:hypothetical protein
MIPQTAVYPKGGSIMEPRKIDTPMECQSGSQDSPSRPPERKRRFQIVKLEERIAPSRGGKGSNNGCNSFCCTGVHRTF